LATQTGNKKGRKPLPLPQNIRISKFDLLIFIHRVPNTLGDFWASVMHRDTDLPQLIEKAKTKARLRAALLSSNSIRIPYNSRML
jgi:hypothetical protein